MQPLSKLLVTDFVVRMGTSLARCSMILINRTARVLSNPSIIVLNLNTTVITIFASVVVASMTFLYVGTWWNDSDTRVAAQEPSTPTEEGAEGQSQHECEDDPSGPNCPPSGTLTTDDAVIDVGESTTVTAANLFNVGTTVRFRLSGPIDDNESCGTSASGDADSAVGNSGGTATLTVYGCSPGGTATVKLLTTSNVELDRVTITVNPPPPSGDLAASKNTIEIGDQVTLTASNLVNVGSRVKFKIAGPLHFNSDCGASSASGSADHAVSETGGTATVTAYGCSPGGIATVRLTTSADIELDHVTVKVNGPPSGNLSAPKTNINVGEALEVTASNLFDVGTHVNFALSGPIHYNESCTGSASGLADTPPNDPSGGTIVYVARMTIYGCMPGGTSTVQLKTTSGILLDTLDITVSPPPPSGNLSASKTTIDIGEEVELKATNLLNVGTHVAFALTGPIDSDPYCPEGATGDSDDAVGTSGGTAKLVVYGCLPGGTSTVKLMSGSSVLGTVSMTVNAPPEYTELIPSPGAGIHCRYPLGVGYQQKSSNSESIRSRGGYVHSATVEIWQALPGPVLPKHSRSRCLEARVINESAPGAAQSAWTGTLYATQPKLMDPEVDLDAVMQGEFSDFIALFTTPDPKVDGKLISTVSVDCAICQGGTIQTVSTLLLGGTIVDWTVQLFSEHMFTVGSWNKSVELATTHTVTPWVYFGDEYKAGMVTDISALVIGYSLDKIFEFVNWILTHI